MEDIKTSKSEMEKIRDVLYEKRWCEEFTNYDYIGISSGLDFLSYLLLKDKMGNLLGRNPDFGKKLLDMNEDLLDLIKEEITAHDELKKSTQDQSLPNYYMLLEKKHNYFHPIYENGIGSIYNHQLKNEKERMDSINKKEAQYHQLMQNKALKRSTPTDKPLPGTPKTFPSEEKLTAYATTILGGKEQQSRQNLLKGDNYIYKVFPKSEARVKALCACFSFLGNFYNKAAVDKDWFNAIFPTDEAKKTFREFRCMFGITLFRLLLREEKGIHKKAKLCIKQLFDQKLEVEEIFPDKVYKECLKSTMQYKISDLSEYKKMMHIVKLFPKSFPKGYWDKISESLRNIITKLGDEATHKTEKAKHLTEFHVACFLISSYRHKSPTTDDAEFFSITIDLIQELQRLIYIFGIPDVILKKPIGHLFVRFKDSIIDHIKSNYAEKECAILKLAKSVVEIKKKRKENPFRDHLEKHAESIFLDILRKNMNSSLKYPILHEVLSVVYTLNKKRKDWIKDQKKIVHLITEIWLGYIPKIGEIQKVTWHLQYVNSCNII